MYIKSQVKYEGKLETNLCKTIPESDSALYQTPLSDNFF